MADQEPKKETAAEEIQSRLHAIAGLLHQAGHLGQEAQQNLADLLDELAEALRAESLTSDQRAHLTDSTHHLLEAVQKRHGQGVLSAARERLEKAVVAVEADAPVAAGIIRRLMEALANLGI